MIGAAIAGGVGALGSAIYGAIASSKENEKSRNLIQQQRAENKKWYESTNLKDYTQRTDAQSVLTKQREMLDDWTTRARATNVVAGGSDESVAMQKQQAADAQAKTMSDIASAGASYKDQVEQQYRANDAALNQQQAQTHANQAAATAQAAAQAVNAGVNLVGMGIDAKYAKKVNKVTEGEA